MKRALYPFAVLDGKAVSSTNTYVQDKGGTVGYTDVRHLDNIGFQFNVDSGDTAGEFFVEASNDLVNWVDLEVTSLATTAGEFSAGITSAVRSIVDCPYAYVRVKYTNATGTGVVSVYVSGKAI